MGKLISVRLNEESTKQLNWLLKYLNTDTITRTTTTDIIQIAINNEFVDYNLMCIDEGEENLCDPKWLENYKSHL